MSIFVNHVHILPAVFREDASIDAFLRLADDLDFANAVCFAPFHYQLEKAGITQEQNEWLAETISPYNQLVGYGTLNPFKEAAPQVRRIAELGFRGIKLHPPAQAFPIYGDWSREAYAVMEELGLIADFHLGIHWNRLKDYDPLDCDEIAHEFPKLRMVYEHVGGWHYYRQVLAVITNNMKRGNHLYAGIASVLDRENQKYWYLGPEGLDECKWQIGPDLLIYGLDFPYNQKPQIQRDLEIIHNLGWSAEDTAALLGGNLRRLLSHDGAVARLSGGDPNPTFKIARL